MIHTKHLKKIIITFLGMGMSFVALAQEKNLVLEFTSTEKGGKVYVAIYDNENDFLSDKTFRSIAFDFGLSQNEVLVTLPEGKYAISAYHDVDGNGVFDKNFFGIPTEPYGFSNNARGKFGPPDFKDSSFELSSDTFMKVSLK